MSWVSMGLSLKVVVCDRASESQGCMRIWERSISHWKMENLKTWTGISFEGIESTEDIVNEGGDA